MTLIAGTYQRLPVSREVPPNGFYLSGGNEDVLLHYSEIVGDRPQPGDEVDVFIYFDTEDRKAATMRKPAIALGEMARLVVADVHPRLGCFLEMGLGRQLLLPLSELPEDKPYRPLPGDEVFVVLGNDKSGRLLARLAGERDFGPLVFDVPTSWRNQWVECWITKSLKLGSFVLIDGGTVGFGALGLIPDEHRTGPLRVGQRVRARITYIREEDGRANLSLAPPKEVGRIEDADKLLQVLQERSGGGMPYSDETPADVIKARFGISKAAFKRALGKLMKDGLVTQKGSWTYLVPQEEESSGGQ